jgi:hypothetical protein
MERSSDKHNPKLDDAMKREVAPLTDGQPVDSRAQESREPESPSERLPDEEADLRRDLGRFLEGKIFPATREEIIADAEQMNAPEHVMAEFERLPEGTYEGFPFVWEALGGHVEGGRKH